MSPYSTRHESAGEIGKLEKERENLLFSTSKLKNVRVLLMVSLPDAESNRFKSMFLTVVNSSQKPIGVRRGSDFAVFLFQLLKKE